MTSGDSLLGQNIACSNTGTYVTMCASGCIYVSSNTGTSFTLTTLTTVPYAVCMSSTGQYQLVCSTGVSASNLYVSINYGATWTTNQSVSTNNATQWIESITMSANGLYMYAGGGGGAGCASYYSTNYGSTWTSTGSSTLYNRTSSIINNTTYLTYFIDTLNNKVGNTLLTATTPTESVVSSSFTGTNRIATDGNGNIVYFGSTNTSYAYSSNGGTSFTAGTLPVIMKEIFTEIDE